MSEEEIISKPSTLLATQGKNNLGPAEQKLDRNRIPLAAVGARVRRLRQNQGLTIRDLAERSSVDKNTIVRLEKGLPTSRATLVLVSLALGVHIARFLEPTEEQDVIRAHHSEQDVWFRHSQITSDYEESISQNERLRLAADGEKSFAKPFFSHLESGQMFGSILELYAESISRSHPGEEFVYCLSGSAKITVAGRSVLLREGETAQFWSAEVHTYAPADEAVESGNLPVLVLSVRFDTKSPQQAKI